MKACSYCGWENTDNAATCSACGTDFPKPEAVDPALANPGEGSRIVATFGDAVQASVLKGRLENAGIEAWIPEELDPSPFGNFPPLAHVTVRVAAKDFESAKALLASSPFEEPPGA